MRPNVVLPWTTCVALAIWAGETVADVKLAAEVNSHTMPSDMVMQDVRNDVLDANVAVAERKPLPPLATMEANWSKWVFSLSGRAISTLTTTLFWTFFSRRDRLRENLDEQDRDAYDHLRLQYVALAREKSPGNPLVEAILTGANGQLRDLLKAGMWRDASTLPTLLDVALMMPNEAALYLLVRELDAPSGHSPELVASLGEIDYIGVLGTLVSPHVRPDAFVRLYGAHPPAKREAVLADLLGSMVHSSPEVFLTWLAAVYDLAARSRSSIRSLVQSFEEDLSNGNRPPLNVALALVFLYLENQQYTTVDTAERIINERVSGLREDPTLLLRGLNAVFEESHALVRWITGSRMWRGRLENVVRLVLDYDSRLDVTIREQLIGILDVLYTIQVLDTGHTSLAPQIEQAMEQLRRIKLAALPFPIFAFAMRSRLHPPEEVARQGKRFFGFFSSWSLPQQALINVLTLLETVKLPDTSYEPVCGKASAGSVSNVTHLAIGDLLNEELWKDLGWSEGQVLIRTTLSVISGLPPSAWTTKRPLAHWPPVPQLNRRLRAYCGEGRLQPLLVFEKEPLRVAGKTETLWRMKESRGTPATHKPKVNTEVDVDADVNADVGEIDLMENTTADTRLKLKIETIGQARRQSLKGKGEEPRTNFPSNQSKGKSDEGKAKVERVVPAKRPVRMTRNKASVTTKTTITKTKKQEVNAKKNLPSKGKRAVTKTGVVRRKVGGPAKGKGTRTNKGSIATKGVSSKRRSPLNQPATTHVGAKKPVATRKAAQKRPKG